VVSGLGGDGEDNYGDGLTMAAKMVMERWTNHGGEDGDGANGKHMIAAPQLSLSASFCQVQPCSAVPRQHPHHPFQPHALGAAVRGAR